MQVQTAVEYYDKSLTKVADALGVWPSAVANWKTRHKGKIPELYARRLHALTRGALRFDPEQYGVVR